MVKMLIFTLQLVDIKRQTAKGDEKKKKKKKKKKIFFFLNTKKKIVRH